MTEQQIVEIMAASGHPRFDGTMADLTGLYAAKLAAISSRLTPTELAEFISIGVALYQRGLQEFQAGAADADSLLRDLQNKDVK